MGNGNSGPNNWNHYWLDLSCVVFKKIQRALLVSSYLYILAVILVSVVAIPNPLGERLKELTSININDPLKTNNYYLKQRIFYNVFGIEEIKDNYFKGIGPQNVPNRMKQTIMDKNITDIRVSDHLHNDFLDIIKIWFNKYSFIIFNLFFHCNGQKYR